MKREIKTSLICKKLRDCSYDQKKYFLRDWPFILSISNSPPRFFSLKVLGPRYWWILKGRNQSFWNLVFLDFASFSLSHLRTRLPSWNYLLTTHYLSNHLLTRALCSWKFCLDFSHSSSSFNGLSIFHFIVRLSISRTYWIVEEKEK